MTQKPGGTPRYALLDHVPEMVTISDRRGRILYANPATERVSGFAPEEFTSLDPFSRMHPEDRPRCEEAFAELLGNPGLSLHLEHRVRHKDGSWRWVEGTFTSLFEDPEVGGLLATVRDVTERKRTEEALRESEEGQAFLLKLSDRMRAERDAKAVASVALRLLYDHLNVERTYIVSVRGADQPVDISAQHSRPDLDPMPPQVPTTDFPEGFKRVSEGVLVIDDIWSHPDLSDLDRRSLDGLALTSLVAAPLHRGAEGMIWAIVVGARRPRAWTSGEVALLQESAERVWAAIERPAPRRRCAKARRNTARSSRRWGKATATWSSFATRTVAP